MASFTNLAALTSTTAFLLLFLFFSLPKATQSDQIHGLDSFLSQQFNLDPNATNDTFLSIPSTLKSAISRSAADSAQAHTQSNRISTLVSSLDLPITVHVKLVGSPTTFTQESASLLSTYLTASRSSDPFQVTGPFSGGSHHLAISHSLNHHVTLSSHYLTSALNSAIRSAVSAAPLFPGSSLASIHHSVVDDIVAEDFAKEKPVHGFYIYLFNLGPQSKPYGYSYIPEEDDGRTSPLSTFSKCMGTIWTGKDRYLLIDLAAGPVDYGPSVSGDGLLPKGEFHPFATLHGKPTKSEKMILTDLASIVHSAYRVLLAPSLRIPVPFDNSLLVQFIHVYEPDDKDSYGLDWKMIENTFLEEAREDDGLLLVDQTLRFKKYEVKYRESGLWSFAISRSVESYTSNYLFEESTLIVNEYVDSKKLHQVLSGFDEEIRNLAGIPDEDDQLGRVLPVYVFDLDVNGLLLLDQYYQSVAFKDMVIAVRSKYSQTVTGHKCNGIHVFTHTRELERPIISSILQSLWGVSPTHLVWSPRHNSTLVDYTWSVGQTPFGPFSELSTLSFVQKDAARRNVVLTWLNNTVTSAVDVLDAVRSHGGDETLLKGNDRYSEFIQRWFLFKYKLDRVVSSLSQLEFDMACYFLRSSEHDLYVMHSIVFQASQELDASLVCFKDPPFPWVSVSMSVVCVSGLCYVYGKRGKLFRNKKKQF